MGIPSGNEDEPITGAPTEVQPAASAPTAVETPVRDPAQVIVRRGTRASIGMRYTLGDEIARGGMGRVVDATDTLLGRQVAIKEALTTDDEILRRFARETRITARLEHPSIVPVHDAGTMQDGSPFYVMRKVSGRPLEELVSEAKTLAKRLALLPNLLAAANAIAHAHHRGVLHRDLKPSNILVGSLGETVVIDWGLAKVVDDPDDPLDPFASLGGEGVHTRIGSVVGTPGFMPPEQLRGDPVDARSDVYALGATLYFMLARRPPHIGSTGDEMMAAALAGPPPPIGELVEGVPRELATIVDKTLAYDADARYRDAGGLAEDLDRFLKGQLVASHRYTPRERMLRFLRRHRIAVTVAAVAALALAVGGWLAIARVVRERNRADSALGDALERNEALELAHARALLATNPTVAVARIKPLARSHWQEVRTVAMAARAMGVARGYAGSRTTLSLELARDGHRALVAGDDGAIRIDDLETGASRTVGELHAPAHAAFADGERAIVAWSGTRLVIFADGAATREVHVASEPVELHVVDATLWWTDSDGAVWSYALGTAAPEKLAIADRIAHLAPHGDTIALGGEHRLWLVRGAAITASIDGPVAALAWSPTGQLAAIVGPQVVEINAAGTPVAALTQPTARSLLWQDGTLYIGAMGLVVRRGEPPMRVGDAPVIELYAGPHGSVIARSNVAAMFVLGAHILVEVPPTSSIGVVAATPESHRLVAGSDGVVLAWNLDDVLPYEIPFGRPMTHVFGGFEQLMVVHDEHSATWVDLPSGKTFDVELGGLLVEVVFADHEHALLVVKGGGAAIYTRGQPRGAPIEPRVKNAAFVTPQRLVIGTLDKDVIMYDTAARTQSPLVTSTSTVFDTQVRGDYVAIAFDDHSLWRKNLVTGAITTLPRVPDRYMTLRDDGEVAVSDRDKLYVWHADGRVETMPPLPQPVTWAMRVDATHVLVLTGGDSGHLVELVGKHRITNPYLPGSHMFDFELDGPFGIFVDAGGRVYVTDPVIAQSWRIGKPSWEPLEKPGISEDGKRVYAICGSSVVVWPQEVPATPEATVQLVERLTNARATHDSDVLVW